MSNIADITRQSYLGIPLCINETVSISNDLAACVGTDARWPSAVRRSMTGEVTGEAYSTDTPLPQTIYMIKHGQLLQAMLTGEEVAADSVGRAVTPYRYRLQAGRPYLPQKDKLVCLYVPRWQSDTDKIYDLSGNSRDMTISRGYITDGYIYRGIATSVAMATQEMYDYTYVIKRELRSDGNGFGFTLHNNSLNLWINETNYNMSPRVWSCGEYAILSNGFAEGYEIYGRRQDYCGQPISAGDRTQYNRFRLNMRADGIAPARPLYEKTYYIAVWSVSLTDIEIQVAQMYLAQEQRPSDL